MGKRIDRGLGKLEGKELEDRLCEVLAEAGLQLSHLRAGFVVLDHVDRLGELEAANLVAKVEQLVTPEKRSQNFQSALDTWHKNKRAASLRAELGFLNDPMIDEEDAKSRLARLIAEHGDFFYKTAARMPQVTRPLTNELFSILTEGLDINSAEDFLELCGLKPFFTDWRDHFVWATELVIKILYGQQPRCASGFLFYMHIMLRKEDHDSYEVLKALYYMYDALLIASEGEEDVHLLREVYDFASASDWKDEFLGFVRRLERRHPEVLKKEPMMLSFGDCCFGARRN